MTAIKLVIGITIYILTPLTALVAFLKIKKKMTTGKINEPPIFDTFIIFVTYGGLLLVALTVFFWEWSGLASLGIFYLIIGAPIAMIIIAYRQFQRRKISKYHKRVYQLSLLYFAIAPLLIYALFLTTGR